MSKTQPTYKERYNLAMLAINDGLWDWNLKTGKVYFDERYYTMAGYKTDEFPHNFEEWKKRVHPGDLPAAMQSIEDHLSNKNNGFDVEFRFKTKSGKWMWIRGRGKAVEYDKNGNVTRFIGTHTDISKQKEAEHQLIEANKRYETVLENALEGVFVLQGNHVVFANKAIQEITGYNLSEMEHKPFLNAVYEKDRANVYDTYQRRLAGETIPSYDMRILSKSGKVRWFLLNSIKIKWEEKDAVLVFAKDIHNRKLAEDKLRESEERLSLITNTVDSVMFSFKTEGDEFRIDFVNDYFFKDTGYKKEDFVGKLLSEVIPPDKYKTLVQKYREAVDKQQNVTWEESSPWKEGMQNAIVSITPVYNEKNQCTHVLGTMSDITERVKAENALKASEKELKNLNATKDRLFSIIGHDLRNPLNNMFGFAFLLQRRAAQYHDEKLNKYIDAISQSAHSVSELLENLLEWSRAQTQEIKVEKGNFYLNEIVEANFKLFYNSAKAKKIKLISKIKPDLMIHADKTMLSTVIRNLISNAVKFTPGNGQIIVSTEQIAGETTVRVHDTGIGMDEKMIQRLFKSDNIQTGTGTDGEKGTGLGLMICKEFIDLHNGKIRVESSEGKGSTFIFTI